MSLPPERISIKRRRQDEPVDTLYLEVGTIHDTKRRFTDFCFHRLKVEKRMPKIASQNLEPDVTTQRAASNNVTAGIPIVRATLPGDEVRETLELKSVHRIKWTESQMHATPSQPSTPITRLSTAAKGSSGQQESESPSSQTKPLKATRRFHLTPDKKAKLAPKEPSGVYKSKSPRKSGVAVFVEKLSASSGRQSSPASTGTTVDRLVELLAEPSATQSKTTKTGVTERLSGAPIVSKGTDIPPFSQPPHPGTRMGNSIRDPPSTWDQSSDQLADELAALALEFDPEHHLSPVEIPETHHISDQITDDDFIYDTYLRLPMDHETDENVDKSSSGMNFGVLVIDEDSSELWQTYAESDEDTEWDEEDADSNAEDNPANDYPEDELSSGDEFGYNSYSHRKQGSDNEEYDLEDQSD